MRSYKGDASFCHPLAKRTAKHGVDFEQGFGLGPGGSASCPSADLVGWQRPRERALYGGERVGKVSSHRRRELS